MIHPRTAASARIAPRGWPLVSALVVAAAALMTSSVQAQETTDEQQGAAADCSGVPDHQRLTQTLRAVVAPGDTETNGGLGNHMWAVVVNRAGVICTVVHSGETFGDQWLGSRPIAAEKAYTANAFSLPGFALSTANLYWPSQPENSLYALATSNPVHEEAFYVGEASSWGTGDDPVVGLSASGARWSSVAASRSTPGKGSWSEGWASAATNPAPTTWSPGSCAARSISTTCRPG